MYYLEVNIDERNVSMIHTMNIQRRITLSAARNLLDSIGRQDVEIEAFLDGLENPIRNGVGVETTISASDLGWAGIHEISVSRYARQRSNGCFYTRYYCYVRLEPLTVITHEKHIALFECTQDNIRMLQNEFKRFMEWCLQLDGITPTVMDEIAELHTWDANRSDYTIDIRMNNHDEVLAMMNLCKMSSISTKRKKALKSTSIYDRNFYAYQFNFGNKSWEVEIYDKQAQIENRRAYYTQRYGAEVYERLHAESQNILRFEYRRKYAGIGKNSTKLESKNVMQFLSEEVAERWFHGFYGANIGYEPFYVLDYQLDKKLAEGFPMTKAEARKEVARKNRYDKEAAAAKNEGRIISPYIKQLLGHKAQKYRNHMSNIAIHNGMQNALNAYKGSTNQFKAFNKRIRRCAGVSPVPIPKNWIVERDNGTGRGLNIPHDFLPNPINRPE